MPSPKRPSNLKAFGKAPSIAKPTTEAPPETAPAPKTDDRLSKTVRVTRAQWRRIRELETDREKTFQALCIEGLSRLFQEQGLEPL